MKRHLSAVAFALLSSSVLAEVQVQEPWVRATVPSQKVTGAFMQLTSPHDVKLVEARSPVAGRVELHEMAMERDVMKMRQVPAIALAAGKPVSLAPGGFHMMLFDLKQAVNAGDAVPLTLVFEGRDGSRESVEVKAAVRPLGASAGQHHPH